MATSTKHSGFKRLEDRSNNPLAILSAGQRRLDIGSATLTQEGAESTALLFGLGTSTTTAKTGTADKKFISFYTENSATSGDNRAIYNRFYLSGAGGGGESLRSSTEISGVAVGTAHGAHLSLGMGESTTGGAVTGLGVAVRATLGLPDVAMASGGTYAAIMPEIYSFGASSDAAAVTELSFIRCVNGGNSSGRADVDDDAYLLVYDGGSNATGNVFEAAVTEANYAYCGRCKINGTVMYMMFSSDAA